MESRRGLSTRGRTETEMFSGTMYDYISPAESMIHIADIAHHLARVCRFTGGVNARGIYSVAEHSVHVSDMLMLDHDDYGMAYAGLMHDAAEAYIGDINRPLKALLRNLVGVLERKAMRVIQTKFEFPWDEWTRLAVKYADDMVCRAEAKRFMRSEGEHWDWGDVPDRNVELVGYAPHAAETLFLTKFAEVRQAYEREKAERVR